MAILAFDKKPERQDSLPPQRGLSRPCAISFMCGTALPQHSLAQASGPDLGKPLDLKEVDSFLAVHADGAVTIYTSKVDVGTGLRAAMSQMVAEELGTSVEHISVVEGDTALTPDQGGTGGSTSIPRGAVEVRQAAALANAVFDATGVRLCMVPFTPA